MKRLINHNFAMVLRDEIWGLPPRPPSQSTLKYISVCLVDAASLLVNQGEIGSYRCRKKNIGSRGSIRSMLEVRTKRSSSAPARLGTR